jgi:hypothetical protein
MTSVTYGMPKSLCKVTFDMYQGALANFLNVLDLNVWRIFVLRVFAELGKRSRFQNVLICNFYNFRITDNG